MQIFSRATFIQKLSENSAWDIIVIGGGATGLGIAVDAASRGFSTLLLEQADFSKGTSSRSTKLVHGGVRYLAQGNIGLVYDALHERGLLLKNAAHLVKRQRFIIPCYNYWSVAKYLSGLTLYDWMAGRYSFGKSRFLGKKKVGELLPAVNTKGLAGGIAYYDGQFDDARLAINLAQTAAGQGATIINYCQVTGLLKTQQKISGVSARDLETGHTYELSSKVVINATGVFVDDILQMDMPGRRPLVKPSQGVHIVLDKKFLPGNSALMIPKTPDGRVLFAVPWHGHILVGTTDTPLDQHSLEPRALNIEIEFILGTIKQYLSHPPSSKDVLSVFAGLRPLAAPQKETGNTKEISRDHKLLVSDSGLITITGGKWTTYRKMAEQTVDKAIHTAHLSQSPGLTKQITIHGNRESAADSALSVYGTDEEKILELVKQEPALGKKLADHLPDIEAQVTWAVRYEMARTVEDVLARRLRILFLDAKAAITMAPRVAELMANELHYDEAWKKKQAEEFKKLAFQYMI